ncbi:YoaK family protein [Devosia naphthalenivorans]|uniref:YoaK family protein n=1 Tax=Devosia naphthalenivorans TaxID=2082392 RepID=UPI000D358ECD|nr:YoaK family protein [Devosia naphthalenivorans]
MLIREGDQRNISIDIRLAVLLAGIAGALNAAGFQAVGLFSANMTGNVSALSDHLGLGQFSAAALFGSLIVLFIAGAFVSGLLIEAGRKRQVRAIYAFSIALEGLLLLLLGGLDVIVHALDQSFSLVLGLSFVMGLQNAATTRISNARVRTTHVSGMATDIGLGIAALCGGGGPEREDALARLRLYTSTIIAFLIGGVLGAILYLLIGGYLLIITAAILFAIALPEVRRARMKDHHAV